MLALARRGGVVVASVVCARTSRTPQSATGTCWPGDAATGCPRTLSPVTDEPLVTADAFADPAATVARTATAWAVTSPLKSDTSSTSATPWALAEVPAWAAALDEEEPSRAMLPSAGYANDGVGVESAGGAETSPAEAPDCPGTETRTTAAAARLEPGASAAAAMPAATAPHASSAAAAWWRFTAARVAPGRRGSPRRRAAPRQRGGAGRKGAAGRPREATSRSVHRTSTPATEATPTTTAARSARCRTRGAGAEPRPRWGRSRAAKSRPPRPDRDRARRERERRGSRRRRRASRRARRRRVPRASAAAMVVVVTAAAATRRRRPGDRRKRAGARRRRADAAAWRPRRRPQSAGSPTSAA